MTIPDLKRYLQKKKLRFNGDYTNSYFNNTGSLFFHLFNWEKKKDKDKEWTKEGE